jgi:hypothetical protein
MTLDDQDHTVGLNGGYRIDATADFELVVLPAAPRLGPAEAYAGPDRRGH